MDTPTPPHDSPHHVDVAIIGSGIAGAALAAVLARQGRSVVVFEGGSHPRFAIGESMILETSEMLRATAELFDVPELAYFSSENYFDVIGSSHGVKRHFSYLHHDPHAPHDPARTLQAVIPKRPHGHELHLYRQDSDSLLTTLAISYGATVLQNTRVEGFDLLEDGVAVRAGGRDYRVAFLVDGGGFRSVVADALGLRERDQATHSRALFTHMVGVTPLHQVGGGRREYGLPFELAEGTLHHLVEGGWLWVIPFDNHPRATNPLCSVGLMLDPRRWPLDESVTPEEEFQAFLERYPAIAKQFAHARAVRPWTRTGRLQYGSSRVVGDRWALLAHAAGFIDPLFSKGLYASMTSVALLAERLLRAFETDTFTREHFLPLEETTLAFARANDRLVANAYRSFAHPRLWTLLSVVWLLGAYTELVKLMSARGRAAGDRDAYFEQIRPLRLVGGGFDAFRRLEEDVYPLFEGVDPADPAAVEAACGAIHARLAAVEWMPQAFHEVLAGKTYLPKTKLRPGLLGREEGFLGSGDYRRHFFGDVSTADMVRVFVREQVRYSGPALALRRRMARARRRFAP